MYSYWLLSVVDGLDIGNKTHLCPPATRVELATHAPLALRLRLARQGNPRRGIPVKLLSVPSCTGDCVRTAGWGNHAIGKRDAQASLGREHQSGWKVHTTSLLVLHRNSLGGDAYTAAVLAVTKVSLASAFRGRALRTPHDPLTRVPSNEGNTTSLGWSSNVPRMVIIARM